MRSCLFKFLLFSCLYSALTPSAFSSSLEYYSDVDDTAKDFKTSLENLLKTSHKPITYTQAWYALMEADEDPQDPNNIILFYSQKSVLKTLKYPLQITTQTHGTASIYGQRVTDFQNEVFQLTPTSIT